MECKVFDSIASVAPEDWQRITTAEFPFGKHAFLMALEQTGCVGPRTGWQPCYVTCWESEALVGALLLYGKSNSYGEYIFDFAWADAYRRLGLQYYPKLVSAIPFTSATGPKLMLAAGLEARVRTSVVESLLSRAGRLAQDSRVSSTHALFITAGEIAEFRDSDYLIRHSFQYHWQNLGYTSFEDFITRFRAKRRKETLRERAQAKESGLRISRLTGPQLEPRHAEAMSAFYEETASKKGGLAYLTPQFFELIFQTMKDDILLVLAEKTNGQPVAGALNFFGTHTLFGRHWGCLEEYRSLHIEMCYYQGIEFAIEKKFKLFEAGAQGEHKFRRGFLPALTYSAHQIFEPRLKEAIGNFIEEEKLQLKMLFDEYNEHSPFSLPPQERM